MNDLLIFFNDQGNVLRSNASACSLLNYREKELTKKNVEDLFFHDPNGRGVSCVDLTVGMRGKYIEIFAKTANDDFIPLSLSAANIYFPGSKESLATVCLDVTRRSLAESSASRFPSFPGESAS